MHPELLDQLAAQSSVRPLRARQARAGAVLVSSGLAALLLVLLWAGARSDIAQAALAPIFWLKMAFPAALGVVAWSALNRSLHPGTQVHGHVTGMAAIVAGLWLLATALGSDLSSDQRSALLWGTTWFECPLYITVITTPMLVAALHWCRGFGPLSPRLTGALAGMASGAFGAALYALHCREPGISFVGTWYVLGASIPAALGMALGPAVLRWPASPRPVP